jgi:uncharacterized protein YndB with AHSA1/START domain
VSAEIRSDVVVATEHIRATPDVVFPYFTDPALIVSWLGERAELEPRPGGVFALDFGKGLVHGEYVLVEPPYRVVFTWGIPGDDALPAGSSTVEVVLTPDGDDTMVVLTHRDLPASRLGDHREGWERQLGRLPAAIPSSGRA